MERLVIKQPAQYQLEQVIYENATTGRSFYRVKNPALGMAYGLKVIAAADNREARTVKHEITALNRLPFGITAKCHQYWQEGNKHFLLMDWIEGKPLSSLFNAPPKSKAEIAQRINVAEKLARKLSVLHRLKVMHRDIKPENIVVQLRGQNIHDVLFIDFGLSNQKREGEEGTYQYRSPEQGLARYVNLSESTDIFSICQVIHFLLKGEPLTLTLNGEETDWELPMPINLPEMSPPQLSSLLTKGLCFNPQKRIRQAFSIANELRTISKKLGK